MARAGTPTSNHGGRPGNMLIAAQAPTSQPVSAFAGNQLAPGAASVSTIQPAPPRIGSGTTPGSLVPPPATISAAQPQQASSDPEQALETLMQQIKAANLTPSQLDQHAVATDAAVHHLGTLLQKGPSVTHGDIIREAMTAVKSGAVSPEVAARFVDKMKGSPSQLQAKLQQAVGDAMSMNVALAAIKQKTGGATASSGQPPINQTAGRQS
ncbi:hypothetical protein HN018_19245 [Lichenicola cladoniae]|uniref:Uncharacterized protein n=1 Tax=Lichenicola cladoniae TaxID=1484109 RepID=A0A6M8HU63_9PROT|nr:hypothetical protein [Lichenicola cladoniae]NPD68283.1 hypothetical protein [Acetobacteraceae bacterium]QKE91882.1 hypothetical protein HN018_19245 [Lichenicola cladoniae]